MKNMYLYTCLLAGLLMGLGACSSDEPTTELSVNMVEFVFEPSQFTVPAGQEITLELANNGAVEHDFVILEYGAQAGQDFEGDDRSEVYWEALLGPGESGTFTFTAPARPGEYQVVCGIEGHYIAGMVATMTVVSGE